MSKATIKKVAMEAGVSTATVSRALNGSGYVSEEVKKRIMGAIDKLNYQPSAIARSLKHDKTYMIGIIVPDISNPYFMGISKGIEDVVGREGFQLMFCSSDDNPNKENRLLQLLNEKRVDAVVLATSGGNEKMIKGLMNAGVPIVLVDRRLDKETDIKLDLVAEDNTEGAYRLTSKLLKDGHIHLGIVNGPIRVSTGRERYEGVLRAMKEYGLAQEPLVFNGEFTTEGGIKAVQKFLEADIKPTAIVSLNNRMSLGVLLEIVRSGHRIPDDMAIASFGEVEAVQLLRNSRMYYIDQHPYKMGTTAGEILLRRIRKDERLTGQCVEIYRNEVNAIL